MNLCIIWYEYSYFTYLDHDYYKLDIICPTTIDRDFNISIKMMKNWLMNHQILILSIKINIMLFQDF